MILLQTAICAGLLLLVVFGGVSLLVMPLVTGVLMRFIWRRTNKQEHIKNSVPYYKDMPWFLLCLVVSFVLMVAVFCGFLVIFDRLFPEWGFYT